MSAPPIASLTCHASRGLGAVSAHRFRAAAGRHVVEACDAHRLLLYETGHVTKTTRCEGLSHTYRLVPGAMDLIPAGASGVWEDSGLVQFVAIVLPHALPAGRAEEFGPGRSSGVAPKLAMNDRRLERTVRALAAEIGTDAPAPRLYIEGLEAALIGCLFPSIDEAGAPGERCLSKPELRRVVTFIDENLSEDLSLERIARVARMSAPHLTTLFRRTTGQSVHQFVMARRVHYAQRLIAQRDLPLAQVAYEAGFSHQSHLSRWTRRLLGKTPAELREA